MKKVLVLNPYLPTLGGGEKYMGYLCKFIEDYFKNNVHIDILVYNYNDIDINSPSYVTIDQLNAQYDLSLKHTFIKKIDIAQLTQQLEDYIEKMTSGYDLFINFMIFSRLISRAPKSIYLCMFPPKTQYQETQGNIIKKLKAKYYDYSFMRSYTKFIIISQYSNHWFQNFWGKTKKSVIVYSPVFTVGNLLQRYDESKKTNIIISVGRFFVGSHSKKQLEMVEFFTSNADIFCDYEYHLVGAVSNYLEDIKYLEKIKEIALTNKNIFVHENCKYEELIKLYEKAKIFWHATGLGINGDLEPEKMEHFGITTVEAMSYGVVPVVINKGGQPEIVEDGVNGYLWDTKEECLQKTCQIMKDDLKRKQMANASANKAKKFSVEEFYRNNKVVFDELQI